jgi:hypothetical protein
MGLPVLRRPLLVKELAYVFIMLYHSVLSSARNEKPRMEQAFGLCQVSHSL